VTTNAQSPSPPTQQTRVFTTVPTSHPKKKDAEQHAAQIALDALVSEEQQQQHQHRQQQQDVYVAVADGGSKDKPVVEEKAMTTLATKSASPTSWPDGTVPTFKNDLQEYFQRNRSGVLWDGAAAGGGALPKYENMSIGPAHQLLWTSIVTLPNGLKYDTIPRYYTSKKIAEQEVARVALTNTLLLASKLPRSNTNLNNDNDYNSNNNNNNSNTNNSATSNDVNEQDPSDSDIVCDLNRNYSMLLEPLSPITAETGVDWNLSLPSSPIGSSSSSSSPSSSPRHQHPQLQIPQPPSEPYAGDDDELEGETILLK
jgi:hypothetical protein